MRFPFIYPLLKGIVKEVRFDGRERPHVNWTVVAQVMRRTLGRLKNGTDGCQCSLRRRAASLGGKPRFRSDRLQESVWSFTWNDAIDMALRLLLSGFMTLAKLRSRIFLGQRFGTIGFICFLSIPLSVTAAATEVGGRITSDNREVLSQAVNGLVSAWNRHDAEQIAELLLADAELIMPNGNVARSRAGIRQKLLDEWRGRLQDTRLSHVVEDVAVLDSGTAVVKGKYRLNGVKVLGFEKSPEGSFIIQHKKSQDRWMIAKAELRSGNANPE